MLWYSLVECSNTHKNTYIWWNEHEAHSSTANIALFRALFQICWNWVKRWFKFIRPYCTIADWIFHYFKFFIFGANKANVPRKQQHFGWQRAHSFSFAQPVAQCACWLRLMSLWGFCLCLCTHAFTSVINFSDLLSLSDEMHRFDFLLFHRRSSRSTVLM